MPLRPILLALFALVAMVSGIAQGQQPMQPHDMQPMHVSDRMGTVHLDTSCVPQVRERIDQAMALLYSFWFSEAGKRFAAAAVRDPQCAMAYWGKAMAGYEQISGSGLPEGRQLRSGLAAIARARSAHERTVREQTYIDALAIIYDAARSPDHDLRVRGYSAAMGALVADNPDDHEAAILYAMSLLKDGMPADPELALSRKALNILNGVLKVEPDNPGVMHFIIHATDNPRMASLGLQAARAYRSVAPAAPHALHMPSHIFARLGLWNDDIQANLASRAAAEQPALMHTVAENRLHALDFLQYAYLQTGDEDRAVQMARVATEIRPGDFSPAIARYYYVMEADFPVHLALETGNWSSAMALEPSPGSDLPARRMIFWARAVGAGHLKNGPAAAQARQRVLATYRPEELASAESHHAALWSEVKAWALFAAGDTDAAIAVLRPAADLQDQVGKGEVELPAREMLADMLRIAGRPAPALQEYQTSLQTDPGRFNTLIHAAAIATALGQRRQADLYYRTLLDNAPHPTGRFRQALDEARGIADTARH